MSRAVFRFIALHSFCALFASSAFCAGSGGLISGVIRNAWSRVPLQRAVITLSTTGADPMDAVTYSDGSGAFAFSGVPGGTYELCARAKGYDRICFGGSAEAGSPNIPLTLAPGHNRTEIVLAALPLGSVSGSVTDGDGDPVPNAQVSMLHANYARRSLHWVAVGRATTNDRGEYRMGFVRPGQYRFMVSERFGEAVQSRPDVTNGAKLVPQIYSAQYYPNTDNVESAASVTLNAGNEIKGIDFVMVARPAAQLNGTVQVPPSVGDSAEMVSLQLFPNGPAPATQAVAAGAGPPEFRFQFPVLSPGQYHLLAQLKAGNRSYFSSQLIDVPEGLKEITVPINSGSPLKGRLQLLGNGAREHGPYTVRLVPGDEMRFLGETPTAAVKDDGTFEFPDVVPGLWDIGVEPLPPGSYIKSMLLGNKDVLTDDMFLTTGSREPLNIALDMNGGIVSGNVFDSAGHGERAVVLLAPEGKFDNVLSFYESDSTDEAGHFEFKSVTPGHYKIYAFDRMEQFEYSNPEFLKPYRAGGEPFDVDAGDRIQRKATLIVRGESGAQ